MPFCAECGKTIPKNAKFCPGCGAKVITELNEEIKENTDFDDVQDTEMVEELNQADSNEDDQTKKKPVTRKVKISKPKADVEATSVSTKDTEYLKTFFTKPRKLKKAKEPRQSILEQWIRNRKSDTIGAVIIFIFGLFLLLLIVLLPEEGEDDVYIYFFSSVMILCGVGMGVYIKTKYPQWEAELEKFKESRESQENKKPSLHDWKHMSPEPLFRQLEQAQGIVAKSSYENLGIDKGNTTRPSAYCYGPHLELFGDVFGSRTDKTGTGKGSDYYKLCEKTGLEGLYTREYDLMVVQFTKNQIMVYKCIFDILEMTKRLEESYEWNYKHVVGINITGDDKEKKLGAGLAVTGTKYLVISAASGDKIEIVLGAGTRQMVGGKQKITALGGEEKIYKVANTAMKNIREAVREGAK